MLSLLLEPSKQSEITLKDGIYYAKINCINTKYLDPKFTRIDLQVIENTFPTLDKFSFERKWSNLNVLPPQENFESYLTRQLRILFKTEAKPVFVKETF